MSEYYICQNGNYGDWRDADSPEAAIRDIVKNRPMSNVWPVDSTRYTVYLASDIRRVPESPAHLILPPPLLNVLYGAICTTFLEDEARPAPQALRDALNRIYTPGTEH